MSKARRPPAPPGRGAAMARQMGLLVDLSPEGVAGQDADAGELEAELLALVGGRAGPGEKPQGRAPLPMEAIERMAALCMKDEEEEGEEDEELEDEDDLMAELQEVLAEGEDGSRATPTPAQVPAAPPEPNNLESTLTQRAAMYREAVANARQAGDGSRLRRYERGLKTLENMLASLKKGKHINEEEIPPLVALGKGPSSPQPTLVSPLPTARSPQPAPSPAPPQPGPEAALRARQRDYKLAALHAKRRGDLEAAATYYRVAKSFDSLLEAAAQGHPPEPSSIPPPPSMPPPSSMPPPPNQLPKELPQPTPTAPTPEAKPASPIAAAPPPAPHDVLEALQQRMERYSAAAAAARAKGDDRKARMHGRILKQYQDAIRAHKAGKPVDLSELPVPPGFQPIQGAETPAEDQSIAGVLEAALRLAGQEEEEEKEEGTQEMKPVPARPSAASQPREPAAPRAAATGTPAPASTPNPPKPTPKPPHKAQQQLTFLEGRRKQLAQAALRAKQRNDLEGARLFLRQAKGLDPLIQASRSGLPVDISKVPEVPVNPEDFVLGPRRGAGGAPEDTARYRELMGAIRLQHEMCLNYSKQFTHLGNIAETTKFEQLAEDCRRQGEILRAAHARGSPPPPARYEQRTFTVLKIFPELSSSDLVLCVVRGINLPAPPGVAPNDLDAFVRFEFPYPNAEEAQKDKTNVIKNTNCPEFGEQFRLQVNRGHRGLRRVLHTKGIKFEVAHKGGLFKTDRVLGTAQLKLEALETTCEVREIMELLDGRRPTGGKLEVIVRIREPLSSHQLETRTQRWLVISPSAAVPGPTAPIAPSKGTNNSHAVLPSLNLLAFEREKLERKMLAYAQAQRPAPPELREQHQDLIRRSQNLRSRLQHGDPLFRKEYLVQLERYLQLYTETARRLGTEGKREAAKEALYKRNLVESELQKLRR